MMMKANVNNICWIFYRVKEWFMRYNNEVFVKYRIDKDSIVFWASDINENIFAAKVLNEFLYDFSKGKKIFSLSSGRMPSTGYRFTDCRIQKSCRKSAIFSTSIFYKKRIVYTIIKFKTERLVYGSNSRNTD